MYNEPITFLPWSLNMDKQQIKNNITNGNQWTRILYMVLFGVILYLVIMVLCFVIVIQTIFAVLLGEPNAEIRRFTVDLVQYLRDIAAFLSYTDEARPYPFQAWQTNKPEGVIIDPQSERPVAENPEKSDTKFDV